MPCKIVFLAVGNADSIIICPDDYPCTLVDVPDPRKVTDWLSANGKNNIDNVYITHAHRDHFIGLNRFIEFINQWSLAKSQLKKVVVSFNVYESAWSEFEKLKSTNKTNTAQYKRLQAMWDKISFLKKSGVFFPPEGRNSSPSYNENNLTIKILHPDIVYMAKRSTQRSPNLNEESLVLRVTYGMTSAILLADLEAGGISEVLSICSDEDLEAQIVKTPHHGAWNKPSADLEKLLDKIKPQIAILSVGSKNIHGHVKPELFNKLLQLKTSSLKQFICTEATKTCVNSRSERHGLGKKGLQNVQPCAGDITVIGELNGECRIETQNDHKTVIAKLKYAACDEREEL